MPKPSPRYLGKFKKKKDEPSTTEDPPKPKPSRSEAAVAIQKNFRRQTSDKERSSAVGAEDIKAKKSLSEKTKALASKVSVHKPTDKALDVDDEAAARLQASFRGKKTREVLGDLKEMRKNVTKPISKPLTQVKETLAEKNIELRTSATIKAAKSGISLGIKSVLSLDPWIPNGLAKKLEDPLIAIVEEVARRAAENEIEAASSWRLRKLIRKQLNPHNWPPPPSRSKQFFLWLRARYMYASLSADKSLGYRVFVEPWMLVVYLSLFLPPAFPVFLITLASWLVYFVCVLPVQDEFQLFNFIARFKVYCFVCCGLLPMIADFFIFYFVLSTAEHQPDEEGFFFWYHLLSNRMFVIVWCLCYVVYYRYMRVREMHYDSTTRKRKSYEDASKLLANYSNKADLEAQAEGGEEAQDDIDARNWADDKVSVACVECGIHTGDKDTGNREQHYLMCWDVLVFAAHLVLGSLDLKLRVGVPVVSSLFDPDARTIIFENFNVTSLSIFCAPFILWKLPVASDLFHQLRPTAYDQAGRLRLQMSLSEMKKLHSERLTVSKALGKTAGAGAALGKGVVSGINKAVDKTEGLGRKSLAATKPLKTLV